ncbi:hypothetical protein [Clostridium brassicae]|uniref:ImmA/IrrE family metallo-endopeptidase n=1 Tax=Clostridium brassicae TaxID=2999072 RepID=A0ABT4D995_9CLOT|nr:hypothetical protein [Clostridium brassicae]MCY6958857.1 hypothetical protein [Clostridium brassicae]
MNIPNKVKIGGVTYSVIEYNNPSEEGPQVDGQILYHKQEIRLKNDMSEEYKKNIFLHEVIHGLFEYIGFEQDEAIVIRLSNALHGFIKDNPDIFTKDATISNKLTTSVNIDAGEIIKKIENYMRGELIRDVKGVYE